MDQIWLSISAFAIGIFVAAPIGPVNLICIRRTLAYGAINGFMSGLGAAIGDGVFAAITAFGLTAITQVVQGYSCTLQLVGGLMLLGFGIHTFLAEPVSVATPNVEGVRGGRRNFVGAFVSTFALTITNPATLVGFAALMAGLGTLSESEQTSYAEATIIVLSVTAGSAAWWFTLTTVTSLFHRQLSPKTMKLINEVSGVIIGACGVALLVYMIIECVPHWFQ
jgi:threonine/homoserine/homoserine lactone efflux protein